MKKFEMKPGIGVGPIFFGQTRGEVRKTLGNPDFSDGNRDGFLRGLNVNYDEHDTVEFIESSVSKEFSLELNGTNLHKIPAEEAVNQVRKLDEYDETGAELGYCYIFLKLQLSLWRGVMPDNNCDPDGRFFEAVGLARKGYFEKGD